MTDEAEILALIEPWAGSLPNALTWYSAQPLPSFGNRTAADLVKSGRGKAVKAYLSRIAEGGFA